VAVTRRQLLGAIGAGWLSDPWLRRRGPIEGRLVGAGHARGHRIRDAVAAQPVGPPERVDVVVVGSGVSGASAAWRLRACGLAPTVLELEPFPGGTSAWSEEGAVPHPWGAHYLPTPNPESRVTLRLLAEHGVVTGWDAAGRPQFREELLCHSPEERLFYRGAWQPGLVPLAELAPHEQQEMARFLELEEQLTQATGSDGRYAFQLPFEHSSRDPRYLELDRISMAEWLGRNGFSSAFLRWYVRYATLDDYGAELEEVSAWAALHYFTARKLRTEQLEGSRFLVWPEGNGRLVQRLLGAEASELRQGVLVTGARSRPEGGVELAVIDLERGEARRIEARAAILAVPAYLARRLVTPAVLERNRVLLRKRPSAPWVVANLRVRRRIEPDLAWDSVLYDAEGLGYVSAGHQLTRRTEANVLTYYRAYGQADTAAVRTALLAKSWHELVGEALLDLAPAHPELAEQTSRVDVMVWGHGMPRPRPGFLGPRPFDPSCRLDRHLCWAHVDQTGFALFEEAMQRGTRAAEAVAEELGVHAGESWL
jgi:protoporphyrinogen oxidase